MDGHLQRDLLREGVARGGIPFPLGFLHREHAPVGKEIEQIADASEVGDPERIQIFPLASPRSSRVSRAR
jgi:hypothetical protein